MKFYGQDAGQTPLSDGKTDIVSWYGSCALPGMPRHVGTPMKTSTEKCKSNDFDTICLRIQRGV